MYSDRKMENQMGSLLRAGVILSCTIMLAGGILYVLRHGAEHESYSMFQGEPAALENIGGILREVRAGSARGIIQLSVLTMIATPVMRVAFAIYGFSRQRQWVFTAISLTVLFLLAFGLSERG
ncbi:MAG TPA: DUF1634 domain-containing protein [Bryobacteraceae bacterium]|jgi:uncharacterized membrane protein